jgi:hypothetical protein
MSSSLQSEMSQTSRNNSRLGGQESVGLVRLFIGEHYKLVSTYDSHAIAKKKTCPLEAQGQMELQRFSFCRGRKPNNKEQKENNNNDNKDLQGYNAAATADLKFKSDQK